MTAKPDERLSTARNREIGDLLQQARRGAQVEAGDIAKTLGVSRSHISNLEHGTRGTGYDELMLFIGYCRADRSVQQRLRDLLREPDTGYLVRPHPLYIPDDLRSLVLHESMATKLCNYQSLVIPGLLQDQDYARAIMSQTVGSSTTDIEPWVDLRMSRQKILTAHDAPEATFYIHESALHAKVGSNQVMRDQLLKLALMCGWRKLTIRLVPFSAGSRSMLSGQFMVMDFPKLPSVVYVEGHVVSLVLEEFVAVKEYQDMRLMLAELALDQEESRSVFANWADRYDRLREDSDEGGVA